MKVKVKKKIAIAAAILALMGLFVGVGFYTSDLTTASAATYTTAKCLTRGRTKTGDKTTVGCPENFKIYMYGSATSGTKTLYQNDLLDWTMYNITVEPSKVSNHLKFELYRNGSLHTSKSLSGNANQTLYSGTLSDGEYELVYTCQYRSNIFVGYTKYEYHYRFEVDKSAPSCTLKAGGNPILNGSFTNKQVDFTATDKNFDYIKYQAPNSGYKYLYSESLTLTPTNSNNGWWYFYAGDTLGNESGPNYVYVDSIAPVGKVTTSEGTTVSNGGYTNKPIKFTATDNYKVNDYEVKKPNSSSWMSYTSGKELSGAYGWYYFRATDMADNVSQEYKVYYDAGAPTGYLHAGTSGVASGAYTNASYVKYTAGDSYSGVANCYVKMPTGSYYTSYGSGTQLASEGTYYFYCTDKSGNMSQTVSITLDKTKPTGTLYGGASVVQSGSSTNAQYIKFVPYDAIGLSATYVKKPNTSSYVSYSSGTQFTAEGTYTFYSVDRAGNVSQYYSVTLDRHIPAAQLYVDEKPIGNNSYTNGAHIKFTCAEKCYVKLPGSSSFQDYVSGTEYYKSGKYVFYGMSTAGTSSGNYTVIIDRTVKTVTPNNVKNGKTSGDVTLTWTDGNKDLYAPIKTVTVNGKSYVKGAAVHTIDTGNYRVKVTDAAGNVWETSFSSTKKNIVTDTLQKEYFEAQDANGAAYSFASYDAAFAFAIKRERQFVTTGEWNSANWDTGMAMDAIDSVNAVNGAYFVYKKSGNPDERVAYFTEERLNEVIAEYAKVGIEDYYYWEKAPATVASGENLYLYSADKHILASSVELGGNIGCLLDGKQFVGNVVESEGEHTLTVKDNWGNSCNYLLMVIRRAPSIEYAVGEGNANTAAYDRTYYFKDKVSVSVSELYDEMAMLNVYGEDGTLLANVHYGDCFEITESGSYTAEAVNHFGKSEIFTFVVSRSAPQIQVTENTESKRLEIKVTASADDESHIGTLEIFKSADSGESWTPVRADDYGKTVTTDTFSYMFCTSGIYKVVITDEFRTGIDAVTVTHDYSQPIPEGVLKGVNGNGYTNGVVSFEWTDEATVTLEKDGTEIEYVSGQKLSVDGSYTLTFENRDGYCRKHVFVIDTKSPVITLNGVGNGGAVSGDVNAVLAEDGLQVVLYKNGEAVGAYASGTVLTESGSYKIVATDLALNQSEVSFTIDKEVDYAVNVNDKGLSNSVTITAGEELTAEITKDGQAYAFAFGDEITTFGAYAVTLTDKLGNRAEFSFIIVKPFVKAFEHNFDDVPDFERVEIGGEERRLNYGTLELKEDEEYEVGVVVGGKTYFFTVTVDSVVPEMILDGVQANGQTNGDVSAYTTEEGATMELFRNGVSLGNYAGEELAESGNYVVKATDRAGNESEVTFTIDKEVDYTINVNDRGLSNGVIVTAEEELTATLTKKGEVVEFAFGEEIAEPAEYVLTLTDKVGNQAEISFVVVDPLVQSFKHNFDDVPDFERVTVNGEEVVLLFGNLVLKEDGMYEVEVTAAGKTYPFTLTVDATAPTIILTGTKNGGTTNHDVSVQTEENAALEIFRNGYSLRNITNGTVTDDGYYTVKATDLAGNVSEAAFAIDKTVDYTVNINDKGLANSVTVTADEKVDAVLTKNGETVRCTLGEEITDPAQYVLTVTDAVGNAETLSFAIIEPLVKEFIHDFSETPNLEKVLVNGEETALTDGVLELKEDGKYEIGAVVGGQIYTFAVTVDGTAPTIVLSGVENGGTTKSAVTLTELSESAELRVYLNGEEVKYNLGDELSERGQYRITVTDACGNASEYAFEIVGGLNGGWIALIVIGCLVLVGGAVTVFILKKKNVL